MKRIFIVGYGKFGKSALSRIRHRWTKAEVWLIDSRPESLVEGVNKRGSLIRVVSDGPRFLFENNTAINDTDWVIPALPRHLAFEWLRLNMQTKTAPGILTPPATLGEGLPFRKIFGRNLYLSYADFVCPDNCPAPPHYCFKTKKVRPIPLWEGLRAHQGLKGTLAVLESRQLAPGLGGFPFKDLRSILEMARKTGPPFYLATACRCHGVVNGLTWL
ncbi:MAG: hypothetical protein AB1585_21700 [Thermodesulfobacteriota bacterium]